MNVLLVTHRFPPDGISGVERYTQTLAAELRRGGDQVTVVTRRVTTDAAPRLLNETLEDGSRIYRIAGPSAGHDRFLANSRWLGDFFGRVVDVAQPDVIHVNHLADHWSGSLIEWQPRVPIVLTLHDFYFACVLFHLQKRSGVACAGPRGGYECAATCFAYEGEAAVLRWGMRNLYFRRLLSLADQIVCPSQFVASFFQDWGVDPARLRVIPNGISVTGSTLPADSTRPRRSRLSLAYFGSVTPHKGVHTILEAIRVANLDSVELLVLGRLTDATYGRQLQKAADAIPSLRLTLSGDYDPGELPLLLREVDFAVVPSLVPETFSLTAREAFGLGVPVLAARIGALPEVVHDGVNGFTYNPQRPVELAAILQRVSEDERLVATLRLGALRTPLSTVSEHTQKLREVYEQAIDSWRSRKRLSASEVTELAFLRDAAIRLGFGDP